MGRRPRPLPFDDPATLPHTDADLFWFVGFLEGRGCFHVNAGCARILDNVVTMSQPLKLRKRWIWQRDCGVDCRSATRDAKRFEATIRAVAVDPMPGPRGKKRVVRLKEKT